MIIAVLQHGLGNQLFQYAAGRAVAARLGVPLFLDTTHYAYIQTRALDIRNFRLRARFLPKFLTKLLHYSEGENRVKTFLQSLLIPNVRTFYDPEHGYDARVETLNGFSVLDGMWQSERYFADLRPQLLDELRPRRPLSPAVMGFIQRVSDELSVALHVRRGDLVDDPYYSKSVGTLGLSYYETALERLRSRLPDARVYVFSDDPTWCARHLPKVLPTEIVSGQVTLSPVEDFVAMKACRHFVIANSTFSWWTAWLGTHPDKQIISPTRFFRQPRAWEVDLLPDRWEKVEPGF